MTSEQADGWPERDPDVQPVGPVTVRLPATSANLGTGFDAVGVALQRYATVTLSIATDGEGERSPMARHVRRAVRELYRELDLERPEMEQISVSVSAEFPLGRGLGASAAFRGAGLVAANALLGGTLSLNRLLEIGAELEGHADNIAPALFGGCQIVAFDGPGVTRIDLPVADGLHFVGFTPSFNMSTKKGRRLLPRNLSRRDAVHQASRAALLVAALSTGSWDALQPAVDDRLHQAPRSELFPEMFDLFEAAESAGAYAAYLSGGGSTLMALTDDDHAEAVRHAWTSAAASRGITGDGFITQLDTTGAQIL